jgi:tRNA (guanine37-N1)-methyltransferase
MMQIHILTLFPDMFKGPFDLSMVKKARDNKSLSITIHDLRKWSTNNYGSVDDHPFGGGPGMVFQIEPLYRAIKEIREGISPKEKTFVILTSAKGELLTQQNVRDYQGFDNLIIICGHYEGTDERVIEHLIDQEISIGKFVLSGGEIPAMAIVDAIARLIPGVLHNAESAKDESYSSGDILEYPQYSRPAEFVSGEGEKWVVPDILLNGNHKEIQKWRDQNRKKL